MAAPVWFFKSSSDSVALSTTDFELRRILAEGRRTYADLMVRYFCDLGLTDQFAYLFQIYNRMPMPFEGFTGSDIMPLPIVELVGKVKDYFDYLVIATPYHDLASQQWSDTSWKRNIDPFLVTDRRMV